MEPAEVVPEASSSSFNSTMPIKESEIMAHLLGTYNFPIEHDHHDPSFGNPSISWSSDHVSDLYYCLDSVNADANTSSYYWPQGDDSSMSTSSFFAPPSGYEGCYLSESNEVPGINASSASMDYYLVGEKLPTSSVQVAPINPPNVDPIGLNEMTDSDDMGDTGMNISEFTIPDHMSQPKRRVHVSEDDKPAESPKKKVHKTSKKVQSKRAEKSTKSGDEEESNVVVNGQSSSCCSSEDDWNASQEPNGGGCTSPSSKGPPALNLNGKTRASRGAATDPQSLYARKRRERINERLRILQNLVPNGTKVDISTMLEEAVQYVKFLQLQIKLLSSDELWMYAPIAYNGMSIGLDLKISPQQQ